MQALPIQHALEAGVSTVSVAVAFVRTNERALSLALVHPWHDFAGTDDRQSPREAHDRPMSLSASWDPSSVRSTISVLGT